MRTRIRIRIGVRVRVRVKVRVSVPVGYVSDASAVCSAGTKFVPRPASRTSAMRRVA